MRESQTPLSLVCYKPMRAIDSDDVPEEVCLEFARGLRLNAGLI